MAVWWYGVVVLFVAVWWCFCGGVVVFFCGGVMVVFFVVVVWCFCCGVAVFCLWWCGGAFVVAGGVVMCVWWWCGVFVVVLAVWRFFFCGGAVVW